MNISFFPRSTNESFTLTSLRLVCSRIEDYCYKPESLKIFHFLKWEQTLGLCKFNKRVVSGKHSATLATNLNEIFKMTNNDFGNKVCIIDFNDLIKTSISKIMLDHKYVLTKKYTTEIQQSNLLLVIAKSKSMSKFMSKVLKNNFYASWVGFDPNLRIQTAMNDYKEIEEVSPLLFVLIKC